MSEIIQVRPERGTASSLLHEAGGGLGGRL